MLVHGKRAQVEREEKKIGVKMIAKGRFLTEERANRLDIRG